MNNKIALMKLLKNCFSNDKISMNYHGVFDDTFTEKLISIADSDIEKKAKKRMALLISESFQNIVRHGESEIEDSGASLFGIRGLDQFLHIFSANSVTSSSKAFLEEKLNEINKMNKDEIKAFYLESLEKGFITSKGGAGLGLIEIARKSERPIQKEFKKIDEDNYAFYMQIDLLIDSNLENVEALIPISIGENKIIHELVIEHNIVFLYKGDFSSDVMNPILSIMRQNISETGNSVGYKIFHTAVELMQNIVRHGLEIDGRKEGIFSLNKTDNGYYVSTTNYTNSDTNDFERFVKEINLKEKEELNQLYRFFLKVNAVKEGNSAGVGLIDIRRSMMTEIDIECGNDQKGNYLMIGIEIPIK